MNPRLLIVPALLLGCGAPPEEGGAEVPLEARAQAYTIGQTRVGLPWRGGLGGGWNGELFCRYGDVAVGIHGRAGTYVDQLGLLCATLRPDGTLGPTYVANVVGGGGGTQYFKPCPSGMVLTDLTGRAGTYLDQIDILCRDPAGTRYSYGYTGPAGGSGGQYFLDSCPYASGAGGYVYAITSFASRSGGLVDGIGGVCSKLLR